MNAAEYDVVVVGAGASGLYCANILREQGANVVVLEARERVGGRTCTIEYRDYTWDVGGQWVGPGQDRAYALAKKYNIPIFPQWTKGKKVLEYFGKIKTYSGTIPPLNILGLIELQLHIFWLDSWSKTFPKSRATNKTLASWDDISVQGYMDKYIYSSAAKNLFHVGVIAVFSVEPREVSMYFFLHYCRCAGGFMKLLDVENGAQQDRVKGGLHKLSVCMQQELGDRVKLNQVVERITREEKKVVVHCSNSSSFVAKHVVVAIPPILCDKIEYEPSLPIVRQHLTQRMPMGQVIKFLIFYSEPFWRTAGYCGDIVTTRGSVAVMFDACVDENYALVGFFEGKAARIWSEKTQEERRDEVADVVYKAFGDRKGLNPTGYIDRDWQREQYSLGGYTGVFPPGVHTSLGDALDRPCWANTLHWAATETAYDWPGYVEGGLCAGEVCAKRIQALLKGQVPEDFLPKPAPKEPFFTFNVLSVILVVLLSCVFYFWFGK